MATSRFVRSAGDETLASSRDDSTGELPLFVRESFEEWYRKIWPKLVAYATVHSGGQVDVGREAAATAAAKAYEYWSSGRIQDPDVWVYTVAMNELRRGWRRRRLERRALARSSEREETTGSPMLSDPPLVAALAALTERQRLAITLRYQCDLTQAQIAEIMRVAPGTIAAMLSTARRNLRDELENRHGIGER